MSGNLGGRPAFTPTEDQRRLVRVLIANGNTVELVAEILGINRGTVRKHFRREITTGRDTVRAGLAGDWRVALSWLARFGGPQWQETQRHQVVRETEYEDLSDEEVEARLAEIERKRALARGEPMPPKPGTVH